ncbi:MAG: 3-hydroxybutyryl-CoA dehydrogenase, partial [Desulfobacteraceae bacterium]|nr:3-hydroxybutyryl-CoA dehydrogenase [Desulfobacteraceae bacterium]
MAIKSVIVVGSGLMGSGIAQVCAQSGISVMLYDTSAGALETAKQKIAWSVDKFIKKGKLTEDKNTILKRITTSDTIEGLADVELA